MASSHEWAEAYAKQAKADYQAWQALEANPTRPRIWLL